ncbi:RNA polymerase sigma factor [Actinomadura harenae]|uniref:RNA polymerase sigma factor 70 region 4 type 2 domain-containing protein n=1 Tax=Actinomadura harenae TaxID=2483351 RepID=A0A3M2LVP4_9ACTN|nr:hypothetical protein [Actinomadura harenae]RMI41584.1 hypothetical protein EBO15_22550 [Actinomadura harenae]
MDLASDRPSDDVVLERALAGDEASFLQLVDFYGGRLSRLAREVAGPAPGRAETMAREALLGIVRDAPPPDGPSPRLRLLRAVIEAGRTRWPLEVAVHPEDVAANGQAVPGVPLSVPALEALRPALDAMPLRFRLPLLLADAEGCDEDEAAWLLGITPSDQLVLLNLGRAALRRAVPELDQVAATPGTPGPDGLSDRGRSRLLVAFRGPRR